MSLSRIYLKTFNFLGSVSIRKRVRTNQQIRVPEVRLIDQSGEQVGIVSIDEAIRHAREANMDLVEISPGVTPPVCRIMDYGKYIFDQKKKQSQQKKKQKQVQVKEIKFRPTTDIGDYRVKCKKITDFLERGDKVKITIRFRGREIWHNDLGAQLLERLKTDIENVVVEQEGQMEGRQMTMVMAPGKGGSQVKGKDKEKKVETDEE